MPLRIPWWKQRYPLSVVFRMAGVLVWMIGGSLVFLVLIGAQGWGDNAAENLLFLGFLAGVVFVTGLVLFRLGNFYGSRDE